MDLQNNASFELCLVLLTWNAIAAFSEGSQTCLPSVATLLSS